MKTRLPNLLFPVALIGMFTAGYVYLFSTDFYQLGEGDLSASYGIDGRIEHVDIDTRVGEGLYGFEDAVVVGVIEDDAFLVDLDSPDRQRVLVITDSVDPDEVRDAKTMDVDGRVVPFDADTLRDQGLTVTFAEATRPDAMVVADRVELD